MAKAERIIVDWNAAPLATRGDVEFEEGESTGSSWLIPLLGLLGVGALAYAVLRERKPKSMPIVLPNTVTNFIQVMQDAVELATPGFMPEARAMVIAHAAYESGWGKARAYDKANNPFNLTTINGPFIPGPDQECGPDGSCKGITQKWALFPSIVDGVKGYFSFIQAPRYTDAFNRLINADVGFLDSLHQGGYFTLPLETYRQNYLSVLARVQRTLANG